MKEKEDIEKIKKDAEQGDAQAQLNLGVMYHFDQDYSKAIKWYLKAAEQGLAGAQLNLGNIYCDEHKGVLQDYAKAVQWY